MKTIKISNNFLYAPRFHTDVYGSVNDGGSFMAFLGQLNTNDVVYLLANVIRRPEWAKILTRFGVGYACIKYFKQVTYHE